MLMTKNVNNDVSKDSPIQFRHKISFSFLQVSIFCGRLLSDHVANQIDRTKMLVATALKAWFPYRCICRVCRTKKNS